MEYKNSFNYRFVRACWMVIALLYAGKANAGTLAQKVEIDVICNADVNWPPFLDGKPFDIPRSGDTVGQVKITVRYCPMGAASCGANEAQQPVQEDESKWLPLYATANGGVSSRNPENPYLTSYDGAMKFLYWSRSIKGLPDFDDTVHVQCSFKVNYGYSNKECKVAIGQRDQVEKISQRGTLHGVIDANKQLEAGGTSVDPRNYQRLAISADSPIQTSFWGQCLTTDRGSDVGDDSSANVADTVSVEDSVSSVSEVPRSYESPSAS